MVVILVVVVLGVGGYLAYENFLKPAAPPVVVAATPVPKPTPQVSVVSPPPAPPSQPVTAPAQIINKAEAVVAEHTEAAEKPLNDVLSEQKPAAPAPSPAAATPMPPAAPVPPPAPAETKVASVAPEPPPAPIAPAPQTVRIDLSPSDAASPAFKSFIMNLRVSGVFQGEHPRVLIGSETYEIGDVVNQDLGVVFSGIDADRELVLFKDPTGVTLVKKY
ncbi:MAG TPA: hypothetical protein VNW23_03120 [Opitutaceae bacterium]|jgi:hypothetical protein|nr:hypothetical protein [Opitutaceae bacterium]